MQTTPATVANQRLERRRRLTGGPVLAGRRLEVGTAIVTDPAILLRYEPASDLSRRERERLSARPELQTRHLGVDA